MNINRYNYEEFFLLYVDNELTQAERTEVEAFVHENPDLEEELVMLKQSMLKPDRSISFEGKEMLMKPEEGGLINETTYEEFFLLYADDELDTILRRQVEEFAASKPQFQQELNLLMQTKLSPDHAVVFPDKSLLYKKEEERKPVVIRFWKIAAIAAMLLLALGILWLNNNNTGKPHTPDMAIKTPKAPSQQESIVKDAVTDQPEEDAAPQLVARQDKQGVQPKQRVDVAVQRITPKDENEDILIAKTDVEPVLTGTDVPRIETNTGNNTISTSVSTVELNHTVQVVSNDASVEDPVRPLAQWASAEETERLDVANTSINKNKLRGLFRKVTRVFEKTTNLPSVEEKGILIGNFEIALK